MVCDDVGVAGAGAVSDEISLLSNIERRAFGHRQPWFQTGLGPGCNQR